jgi:hypothetical protein
MKRILLTGPEVRKALETGRVEVRRAVKGVNHSDPYLHIEYFDHAWSNGHDGHGIGWYKWRDYIGADMSDVRQWYAPLRPIGKPGDKVWGAETGRAIKYGGLWAAFDHAEVRVDYECDGSTAFLMLSGKTKKTFKPWANRSSASMPQWASRLTLEIETVSVEHSEKQEWVYELKKVESMNGKSATPVFSECMIGTRIWFAEEKRPYRVRARNDRYLVCTKPHNLLHTVLYTIIDLHEKVRGTENLIFGSGAETDEQCAEMIDRLSATDNPTEVSHRNRIPCVVVRIES